MDGDWSLNTEYCNAVLRAAILEGEVYIVIIEREGKREIASVAVLFPPGPYVVWNASFLHISLIHFQTNRD